MNDRYVILDMDKYLEFIKYLLYVINQGNKDT